MKNTVCEKLMWAAMTPTIFQHLAAQYPDLDLAQTRKQAHKLYLAMVRRTPDIGSFVKNSLRVSLSGGIVWLSVYDAMDGRMSHEQFGAMVKVTMQAPLIQKAFGGKNPFDSAYQQKKVQKDAVANAASSSSFNWITETIPGRDQNEYRTNYRQCGLCALGRQEHHEDLIPYMCEMDYISVELMGGVLHRTGTLATGASCCDFYVCKKGSKWDVPTAPEKLET